MTRIILVRHAEAEGNALKLFQGRIDMPVSEKGKKQLDLLALRCRNMARDAIYTSPLRRAKETAEAINQFNAVPLYEDAGLMEINGGVWDGKPWADFATLYPEDLDNWNNAPWNFAPDEGEAMTQVYDRVYDAVCRIAEANKGKTVFVVSHGCAIRNLLCRIKHNDIHKLNEVGWGDNTSVSYIDFDENMIPTLTMETDASHLDAETSSVCNQVWRKEAEQ